jgi:transposase InsO family protein
VTLRAVEQWVHDLDAPPKGPLGRPRIKAETRAWAYQVVAQEWHLQGIGAGEDAVFEALRGKVSRTLVRESLQGLKTDLRRRTRERLERNRQHIEVLQRDAMWSLDAQELARGIEGQPGAGIVQAEMIRDVASMKTILASAGPPADASEIIALLVRAGLERGWLPLVLVTDNGGPYRSKALRRWLRRRKVIHLFNEPHTPEHNPWVEHGHGEHQQEMMLDACDAPLDLPTLRAELARATSTLDHGRLRATRGWKTADECDLGLPPASGVISRAVFYRAACQAIARAVEGLDKARERRRAEREAILATLQSFGLIIRTRGGVPVPAPRCELIT